MSSETRRGLIIRKWIIVGLGGLALIIMLGAAYIQFAPPILTKLAIDRTYSRIVWPADITLVGQKWHSAYNPLPSMVYGYKTTQSRQAVYQQLKAAVARTYEVSGEAPPVWFMAGSYNTCVEVTMLPYPSVLNGDYVMTDAYKQAAPESIDVTAENQGC